jgi:hypothetical protein
MKTVATVSQMEPAVVFAVKIPHATNPIANTATPT